MQSRRSQDRRYPLVVVGFLVALVSAGLLGVPASWVVLGGAAVAGLSILLLRGRLEADLRGGEQPSSPARPVQREYTPSVLEASSVRRRRRDVRVRRGHHAGRPRSLR